MIQFDWLTWILLQLQHIQSTLILYSTIFLKCEFSFQISKFLFEAIYSNHDKFCFF